jgi:hypothetical protein
MATQLLGANASLNAAGGVPGAAPTVLQGALVVGGGVVVPSISANVLNLTAVANATPLTVTKATGTNPTAIFTDGGAPNVENKIVVRVDNNTGTTGLEFTDANTTGNLFYQTGVLNYQSLVPANQGVFQVTGQTRLSTPGGGTATALVVTKTSGTDPTAVFTDGGVGVDENKLVVRIDNGTSGTGLEFTDSSNTATMNFNNNVFKINKAFYLDDRQAAPYNTAAQSGVTNGGAQAASPISVTIPGLLASAIVQCTLASVATGVPVPFRCEVLAGQIQIHFTGANNAAFYWTVITNTLQP